MKRSYVFLLMIMFLIAMCFAGCGDSETVDAATGTEAGLCEENVVEESEDYHSESTETQDNISDSPEVDEKTEETTSNYYLNEQGDLVDKVEEFETQTFGDSIVKYPILNDGVDEVVVYEFDTYDNIHVILDASNVYQQTNLDEIGDYGDVQLEQIAPGKDIAYMFDGEMYYIKDYYRNLLTISKPISNN